MIRNLGIWFIGICLLVVGCWAVPQFGIGWDEDAQIRIGKMNYNYITGKDDSLINYVDKDYGVAFELPVYAAQRIFKTPSAQYYFRHYCVHFLFLISLYFFYRCLLILFEKEKNNSLFALLGVVVMVISPRIYADSFFNSKDVVLLSVSILNFYTLIRWLKQPSWNNILWHSITSAVLLDIRIIGIINIAVALGWMFVYGLNTNAQGSSGWWKKLIVYVVLTALMLFCIWPFLYISPFKNFAYAFNSMKHFRWDGEVLFAGRLIKATQLPSHYALTWVSITTPVFVLVMLIISYLFLFIDSCKVGIKHWFNSLERKILLTACMLAFGPLLAVIIFNSVLYNAWRQLYYIYPYMVMLAVYGFYRLWSLHYPIVRFLSASLLLLQIISISRFYVQHFPFINVYFNECVPHKQQFLSLNYERDYWGLSYKQGLDFIVQRHSLNDTIHIAVPNHPGRYNAAFFENKKPVVQIYYDYDLKENEWEHIDYYLTNFLNKKNPPALFNQKIWSQSVQQNEVIAVFNRNLDQH